MAIRSQAVRKPGNGLDRKALVKVVDNVPATRGMGVLLRHEGRIEKLRGADAAGGSILFELRERHINSAYLAPLDPDRIPSLTAGQRQAGWSVLAPGVKPVPYQFPQRARTGSSLARPISRVPNRNSHSVPPKEWRSLGLNCAGAAIGWIGVVGTGMLAPFTGGLSGLATVALYAGALAGTGQCVASVYRVNNAARGRSDINDELDRSRAYQWSMLGADAIGLFGAGAGLRGAAATGKALKSVGATGGDLLARSLPRAVRGDLSIALGINGMKLGTRMINKVVRQRLLDGAGGVLGVVSSVDGGIVRELIVWVIGDPEKAA